MKAIDELRRICTKASNNEPITSDDCNSMLEIAMQDEGHLHSLFESISFITQEVFDQTPNQTGPSNYQLFCKQYPEAETGLIERLNVCIDWAKEFEAETENRVWDGEWREVIDSFIDTKLSQKKKKPTPKK